MQAEEEREMGRQSEEKLTQELGNIILSEMKNNYTQEINIFNDDN